MRTLLFDAAGVQQRGYGQQCVYQITLTPDGGVEADPAQLLKLCDDALSAIHEQMRAKDIKPAAIAFDTFWHSFLGVDQGGSPTTPLVHLFDTRSARQVDQLLSVLDMNRVHQQTGCRLHTSYWPAKLLWLQKERPREFAATERWMSFGEYLLLKTSGEALASTSMVSGSGLWNQAANDYEDEVLSKLPVSRQQLALPGDMDRPATKLIEPYKTKWPWFDGIPWYPALGDGACNNIGSGCTTVRQFSLMVGTSGAMRAVNQSDTVSIPDGLWCYRVDRKRFVLGGALSNGGDVYAWMRRTLNLPAEAEAEQALLSRTPGEHGLTLLPFFAGERSPYWRSDLRAAITGLSLSTKPIDILHAALESISLRFREICLLMAASLGQPTQVIASGGALLHSPAWTQMMADAIGIDVLPCVEAEATGRGAALLAAERLGAIPSLDNIPFQSGTLHQANAEHTAVYEKTLDEQRKLIQKLFIEK